MGKTYDLELHRPKEDKVPYICKLTFNAPGDDFGDIVQVRAVEPRVRDIQLSDISKIDIQLYVVKSVRRFIHELSKKRLSEICNKLRYSELDFN